MAYLCDIYSHHTLIGQNYDDDTLFIQINLGYGLKDNSLLSCYKMMDKDNSLYVKNFEIYELNMDKYKEFWYDNDKKKIEDNSLYFDSTISLIAVLSSPSMAIS